MLTTVAIWVYLSLIIFTVFFQLGLVLKMPWGEYTMGGYVKGVLPLKLRISAFVSAVILSFIGYVGLEKAGLINLWLKLPSYFIWFVVCFMFLGIILNSITKSKKERALWLPIIIILFLCSLYFSWLA